MIEQIKQVIKEGFKTQRAFCEQAGYNEKDFPTKLKSFQKSVARLDKFLKQFDLKLKLVLIDEEES